MEITPYTIYFISTLSSINTFLIAVAVICLLGSCFSIFPIVIEGYWDKLKKHVKTAMIAGVICAMVSSFIPNQQTIAAMYILPKIANNEKLTNIGENSLTLLQGLTEKWIKDLLPENTNNDKK